MLLVSPDSSAQTTHYVTTDCNVTKNPNSTIDVRAGDKIVVKFIAYTNTGWENSYLPQNGCGWYTLPRTDDPLTITAANPLFFTEGSPAGTDTATTTATLLSRGQNATVTFTVGNDLENIRDQLRLVGGVLYYALGRRWERQDIDGATADILKIRPIFNEAPSVTGAPESVFVLEDVASDVSLGDLEFADADDDDLTVTVTASAGTFGPVASSGGVTAALSGREVMLSGRPGAINAWLDANPLKYTTPKDAVGEGVATLAIAASDGSEPLPANPVVLIDSQNLAEVTGVTARPDSGYFKAGDLILVEVGFDDVVNAGPDASLLLDVAGGRAVPVASGTGTDTLVFEYVVKPGDMASGLGYVDEDSLLGAVTGPGGNAADRTLPAAGAPGSFAGGSGIVIDTTPPVVSDGHISLSGATGTGGVYRIGDTLTATWVVAEGEGDEYLGTRLGSVTFDFSAFGGRKQVRPSFDGEAWRASYVVRAGESVSGEKLNVAITATDEAGNATTSSDSSDATVDATPPVVNSVDISVSGATGTDGVFRIGDTVVATWDSTAVPGSNEDIATVTFDFSEFGGPAALPAVEASGRWAATYVLALGDIDSPDRKVTVEATDRAGNSSVRQGQGGAAVDNSPPTIVDADIKVSGGTGPSQAFRVGDTVTVEWTANNADEIHRVSVDFSAFDGPAQADAIESGGVWKAEFLLSPGSLSGDSLGVSVTAYDDAGNKLTTSAATVHVANTLLPSVFISGPTGVVAGQFPVNIEFSEAVSSDLEATELRVRNGTVARVQGVAGSPARFVAMIDPVPGNTVAVQVLAGVVTNAGGNANTASNEFTVFAGSPASVFDEQREEIRKVLVDEAERSLRSALATNQRAVRGARDRFIALQGQQEDCVEDRVANPDRSCDEGLPAVEAVPLGGNASAQASDGSLSASGSFFGQTGSRDGRRWRVMSGDVDVQRNSDSDSSTAILSSRLAWEQRVGQRTLFGYFAGVEFADSTLAGTFEGQHDRFGGTIGAYGIHRLAGGIYLDGYMTWGLGRNQLEMANDVLSLQSDYDTRTATAGVAVSGAYDAGRFEFLPELGLSFGRTWIGDVGFTGRAYGLVDDGLTLDAGSVRMATLLFRPELRLPLGDLAPGAGQLVFAFTPRLGCERVEGINLVEECGAGLELGLRGSTVDGRTRMDARIQSDRFGDQTLTGVQVNFEHSF